MTPKSRPVVQQFAGHYLNMGLAVVPLAPRAKKCVDDGWTRKTYDVEHFAADANIGLRSVDGIVVLDDDFPVTSAACDNEMLPPTGATWGRAGRLRSKRLYRCPELKETITLPDIDGAHLLQLRVGLQDMAPPSVHPDTGERLKWDGLLLPPLEISFDALVSAVVLRWTAGLIAAHWPARGRHELRLAYSRVLLETLGLSDEVATTVLQWACRLGGSDEKGVQDARRAVADTRKALDANEPAWGSKKVAQLLAANDAGRRIVSLLREKYGRRDALEEAVEAHNGRFGIVSVGNKVVVMENWPDGGIKELWPFEEFKKLLVKEHIEVGPEGKRKTIPLAKTWLEHRSGRRHGRLVYAMPGGSLQLEPDDYNGYLGFTVTPKAGDWSKNRDHMLRILCGGDVRQFDWLFNWCAALVQLPGRHAMSAVVLMGDQGVGKGHFAHQMLGALFHKQQYLHIIGAGMLTGQFNEHLSGKVLVFADESTWGGDLKAADKLKGMVTESTVPIERKFLPLVEEPSALHIVIASNNEWPIAIPKDDRRFMVLDVAATERQNDGYFTPLREELKNGGLAAVLHDLLAHAIDEHALRHPPSTKGKREVMAQSLKPIEHWWYEKLLTGVLLTENEGWPSHISKAALHYNYLEFLERHHTTRAQRSTQTELGRFLKKFAPMVDTQRLVLAGGKQEYVWFLPLLENCRRQWVQACGWSEDFSWAEE